MKHIRYIALWLAILFLLSLIPRYNFALGDETAKQAEIFVLGSQSTAIEAKNSPISSFDDTERIIGLIELKSAKYGVNPRLAIHLARIESNFNPSARNPNSSAKGVYQFIDSSWEYFCEGNPLNAEQNIDCAMKLLGEDMNNISHWKADKNTKNKLEALKLI